MRQLRRWRGDEHGGCRSALPGESSRRSPRAETFHTKWHFTASGPDEDDFRRALAILKDAGFTGPPCLIYDGPDDDEWSNLDRESAVVTSVFHRPVAVSA